MMIRNIILSALVMECYAGVAQNLQFHYDFRHSIDPTVNPKNFPVMSFEYFRQLDTLGTGSFLLKLQADFNGTDHNISQVFTQVSQSLRFWSPKIYLSLQYSGGLGVTSTAFGFYIANAYAVGMSYPFQWRGAWVATNLLFRYNAFKKPSYDPQLTLYFGRGFFNYKIFIAGSFVFWTENKDRGMEFTANLQGKKFAFFGDPQIWIKVKGNLSAGSRINVLYHLITNDNRIQCYPTFGLKYQF